MASFSALVCVLLVGQAMGWVISPRGHRAPFPVHPEGALADVAGPGSPMKYAIIGYKNQQGVWTEDVKVEHGTEDWHAEIAHNTLEDESGKSKVQIKATFTADSTSFAEVEDKEHSEKEPAQEKEGTSFRMYSDLNSRDWFGARKHCEEMGGYLAIPDTKAKLQKMTELLREYNQQTQGETAAFVGFNDIETEGNFVTIFGKPVFSFDKSVWSPGWFNSLQPDDDKHWTEEGEDCGSLRPNGGLNDVPCRYILPYICEMPPLIPEQNPQAEEEDTGFSSGDIPYIPEQNPQGEEEETDPSSGDAPRIPEQNPQGEEESSGDEGSDIIVEPYNYDNYEDYYLHDNNDHQIDDDEYDDVDDKYEDDGSLRLFPSSENDWFQANEVCRSWGGRLAIPDSAEKVHTMATLLKASSKNPQDANAFVGFNDIEKEGEFLTFSGKPLFDKSASWYPRWLWKQPDDDKAWSEDGEDCGAIYSSGGLNDVPCRYHLPFFCEKSKDAAPLRPEVATTVTVTLFAQTDLDWAGAKDECEKWGGHLATPDSLEKVAALQTRLVLNNVTEAFLGFEDQDRDGKFVTILGKIVPDEIMETPSGSSLQYCGAITSEKLVPDFCERCLPFICEKPGEETKVEIETTEDSRHVSSSNSSMGSVEVVQEEAEDPENNATEQTTLAKEVNVLSIAGTRNVEVHNWDESDGESVLELDNELYPISPV